VLWPDRLSRHLARTINRLINTPEVRLLDFGGTDGRFAEALAKRMLGVVADRVEIDIIDSPRVIRSPDPRIVLRSAESLDGLTASSYDVVIASAVLEHIPAADETLRQLLQLLRAGGVFYARTPYAVPIIKLAGLFNISMDFTYPGHVHDMGQDFWESYFMQPAMQERYRVIVSRPSIVETAIRNHPLRSIAAIVLKAPWYVFGRRYRVVGGWEVFVQRVN
jgi:SAM-dependent methyltransferase